MGEVIFYIQFRRVFYQVSAFFLATTSMIFPRGFPVNIRVKKSLELNLDWMDLSGKLKSSRCFFYFFIVVCVVTFPRIFFLALMPFLQVFR